MVQTDREHILERFQRLLATSTGGPTDRNEAARTCSATGGVVVRSYITDPRQGRIQNFGLEKLAMLAAAISFPQL